jgi:PAS domain S-box-containing protein
MVMTDKSVPGTETLPAWIHAMGVAVWVSDEDGTIVYMNERAETLLGREAQAVLGSPCHQVIAGKTEDGQKWCDHNCRVREMAKTGEEIEPYTLRINGHTEEEHWLQLLVIPFTTEDGVTRLAHCAFRIDRTHIIESYLDRVAARTPVNAKRDFDLEESRLSRRERQVLDLLAQDKNLYEIAEQLGVSYYTVRNHVQHVLGKMGVHSTLEAVALYLLSQSQDSDL